MGGGGGRSEGGGGEREEARETIFCQCHVGMERSS